MRVTAISIFYLLIPLACVIGAIYLAFAERAGWGWFLLAALITAGSFSVTHRGIE